MFTDGIHVTREDREMLPRLLPVWLLVAVAGNAMVSPLLIFRFPTINISRGLP